MTDWSTCPAVERNPRKISGAWAFTGTRVPVYALFENLESGATVQQFWNGFPRSRSGRSRRFSTTRPSTSRRPPET